MTLVSCQPNVLVDALLRKVSRRFGWHSVALTHMQSNHETADGVGAADNDDPQQTKEVSSTALPFACFEDRQLANEAIAADPRQTITK